MPKQIDWDAVARSQRAQRHGSEYAYDELPPVGSYADRARYLSGDTDSASSRKTKKHAKPQKQIKKSKPSTEERLRNLHRTIEDIVVIFGSEKWNKKGPEYQQRLLLQLKSTLNSMLKLDPSKSSETISLKANRLLADYGLDV